MPTEDPNSKEEKKRLISVFHKIQDIWINLSIYFFEKYE